MDAAMHRLELAALLTVAAGAAALGFASEAALSHYLLATALVVGFFASDARYWKR
jgi:hypothetical protein